MEEIESKVRESYMPADDDEVEITKSESISAEGSAEETDDDILGIDV